MGELVLVRHAQASFGSDDYDRLSELGFEQARHLGDYFRVRNIEFDRVICGTQQRHLQTLRGMGIEREPEFIAGLNEFDFHDLVTQYLAAYPHHGAVDHKNPREFFLAMRKAVPLWSEGKIAQMSEPWSDYHARIQAALQFITEDNAERVLVVCSGGTISALLREVLQISVTAMVELNLQIANTSVSRVAFKEQKTWLQLFNSIAHLDHPATRHLMTFA